MPGDEVPGGAPVGIGGDADQNPEGAELEAQEEEAADAARNAKLSSMLQQAGAAAGKKAEDKKSQWDALLQETREKTSEHTFNIGLAAALLSNPAIAGVCFGVWAMVHAYSAVKDGYKLYQDNLEKEIARKEIEEGKGVTIGASPQPKTTPEQEEAARVALAEALINGTATPQQKQQAMQLLGADQARYDQVMEQAEAARNDPALRTAFIENFPERAAAQGRDVAGAHNVQNGARVAPDGGRGAGRAGGMGIPD